MKIKTTSLSLLAAGARPRTPARTSASSRPRRRRRLIENPDAKKRPVVLDTRGGYKDYFRGHLPTAHHINFDTLRGTDAGVPVQYLPADLTKATPRPRRAPTKTARTLIYATGEALPNDEILSASMVAFVLEKYGIKDIKIVDGGMPGLQGRGTPGHAGLLRQSRRESSPEGESADRA